MPDLSIAEWAAIAASLVLFVARLRRRFWVWRREIQMSRLADALGEFDGRR